MATARAHHERVRGRTKPETYAALAEAWAKIPVPYQVAKARWWQAQAALPTRARRGEARRALTEAWRIAGKLPAAPLRNALRDLAQRGRITLPADDLVAITIKSERELVAVGPAGQRHNERRGSGADRRESCRPVLGRPTTSRGSFWPEPARIRRPAGFG